MTETYAAQYGCADANWVRCILLSFLYADYNIVTQWPKHLTPIPKYPTVLRTDRVEVIDPFVSLLSDSKNVYDALNNELPQDDKKAAVETPIIEELLDRMRGRSVSYTHLTLPTICSV